MELNQWRFLNIIPAADFALHFAAFVNDAVKIKHIRYLRVYHETADKIAKEGGQIGIVYRYKIFWSLVY